MRLFFHFTRERKERGQDIVRQGDEASFCFIILSGVCEVLKLKENLNKVAPATPAFDHSVIDLPPTLDRLDTTNNLDAPAGSRALPPTGSPWLSQPEPLSFDFSKLVLEPPKPRRSGAIAR